MSITRTKYIIDRDQAFFIIMILYYIHVLRSILMLPCINDLKNPFQCFSPAPVGLFLALSAAGNAGKPLVHNGERLGPERAPWRVVWGFIVAKSGK